MIIYSHIPIINCNAIVNQADFFLSFSLIIILALALGVMALDICSPMKFATSNHTNHFSIQNSIVRKIITQIRIAMNRYKRNDFILV